VADGGSTDDRPTVDLHAGVTNEFTDEPRTVLDDQRSFAELADPDHAPSSAAVREPTHELTHDPALAVDPATSLAPAASGPLRAQPDEVHQLPTQQLPGPRPPSLSKHSSTTSSPVDAMKFDEIARTRVFLRIVFALTAGGMIVALSTTGDHVAKVVVLVGSIAAALGSAGLLIVLRDPARYQPSLLVATALPIAFGSMAGVYYWGVGSPVAALLVYGIYFFSLGSNRRVTTAMYVLVAVVHGAMILGVVAGLLVDHGVVRIGDLPVKEQIALLCIIEALYFVAYFTARVSQRVTLDAMGKLEQAVRGNAQRDALLAEARAELDRALKIGGPGRFTEQVIGSFRLGVLIGRGGMGEVYEALAVADRREAAVKLLNPGMLEPVQLQRFLREAHTASRLDCPHIVRVIEVGTTAGELPFLAMERLRGSDLAHQLRRQRRLELASVKVMVDQLAIGLEAARVAGIVHRDLKPHNVFLAEDHGLRRWKILDFGVSKSGGSGTLTQGHVVGTPAYMAPEQARGEDVDHRADVYSLAAIIFRSITGHPVFTGKDVPSTLYEVVYRIPTRPSLLAPLPTDVDRVLAIGLAKDPRDRFAFALELARWFSAAVGPGLEVEQRRRADELIARAPWGTRTIDIPRA
jgi:serine/threonine-protein kinase